MRQNGTMRKTTIIAALVCAPLLAHLSPAVAASAAVTRVRLQLNWLPEPEFGGIYAAELRGAFGARGLDVEILKGGPDVPAVQMAAAGRVEFAVAAADEVLALRDKGADVVALYATYQTSPQAIMVRSSRQVTGIKQLLASGGTLIAQPGLTYLKWLRAHFDMIHVKIVPYGSGAMAQFLDPKAGDIAMQCFLPAEPITARRLGVETNVFLIANTGFNPYTTVIVTRRQYLDAHRDVCRALVAALREGWRAYLDDPEPANRVMAGLNTSMDPAELSQSAAMQKDLIESQDTRLLGLGAMNEQRWATLSQQLFDLAVISTPIPAKECFVNLQ
jgi:NitT/TauT family transport system substrate-binding protein